MHDYLGWIVIGGIFGCVVLARIIISKMEKKTNEMESSNTDVSCPFCKKNMTDLIKRVARSSASQEVTVDCPSCQLKALWCVTGFPPIMLRKVSRPSAVKDKETTDYSDAS